MVRLLRNKMYLCKLIMQKLFYILTLALVTLSVGCIYDGDSSLDYDKESVVATVDGHVLLREDIARDMPAGLTGVDSVTFARMYIDNWVLTKLKVSRAEQVLSSSQRDIERLVEGYRQSLIIRQLDQYYIDRAIDVEITDKQLASYYRAHSASFKLDHNKVRGVVVKAPLSFRNTSTLTSILKSVLKSGDTEELRAFTEKLNLGLSDCSQMWVSYSDFLSNLPTVRTRSYNDLISKRDVQQMTSDDAIFYFIITDRALKGETAPLASVESDIRRRLYAERRAEVVAEYEAELKRQSVKDGRVMVRDEALLRSMSYDPAESESASAMVRDAEEIITEDEVIITDTTTAK